MRRKPCFVDKDSYHLKNGRGSTPTTQKEFMEACQDPQWNLDVSTHHRSEANGVAGRAVRTVKTGTARRTWAKRPPRRMVGLCDRVSCVNAYDKMAGKNSSREKILEEIGQTVSHFTALVDYIPNTAKDEVRVTCLRRKSRGTCSGYVLCAGEDGQATCWLRIMDICRNKKLPKFTSKDLKTKKYLCKVHRYFFVHIDILKFPALRRPSSIDCGRQFSA